MGTSIRNRESACPICNFHEIVIFLEISQSPCHCNLLWPTRDGALRAPRGDIHLGFCGRCGHIFNVAYDRGLMQYAPGYENSLHFSPCFKTYASSVVSRLIGEYDLYGKNVIDIGCGKGEFLAMLCELGNNHGIGFDPSYTRGSAGGELSKQITVIEDFYSERYAHYNADLICCRHLFEHLDHPIDFLTMVRRSIGNDLNTLLFFEVPNVQFILKDLSIWDIIYEHYSYFNATSLEHIFLECGFTIRHIREEFEGQFLSVEAFPSKSPSDSEPNSSGHLEGIVSDVAAFKDRYDSKVEACKNRLRQIENAGQRVVIWGAGSKGVSFLNTLNLQDQIEYVVDINPRKENMYIAGTGQQIVRPDFLAQYKPDVVLVMNPIYETEIRRSAQDIGLNTEFRGHHTCFLT